MQITLLGGAAGLSRPACAVCRRAGSQRRKDWIEVLDDLRSPPIIMQ
jgi:hypothetical protein